jgi:hypothetical protein
MHTLGQFIAVLLLIGFVGAYFWPIALTLAAAYLSYQVVLRALMAIAVSPTSATHPQQHAASKRRCE